MRRFALVLAAASMALPVTLPTAAQAKRHRYHGQSHYVKCRHSAGTTGLVAGGVGGAVLGHAILGGGLLGAGVGAVGGALGGRAIDRSITAKRRCR